MNDKKIFKMCVITTIIGMIAIVILSGYVNPEKLSISKIDKSKIDNQVEIIAIVNDIQTTKSGTKIIKLYDNTSFIDLVIFPSMINLVSLKKGNKITVIARVTEYNGQIELILDDSNNLKLL